MYKLDLILALYVLVGAGVDLATRRIPNRLVLCGLLSALGLQALAGWPALALGVGGAALGLLLFLPLYMQRAMAAGDVKLLAMVGAFVGPTALLAVAMASVTIGALMALAIALARGQLRAMLGNTWHIAHLLLLRMCGEPVLAQSGVAPSIGSMPYGLAIALGTLVLLLLRWRVHA